MACPTLAILDDPIKVASELGTLDDLDVVWVGHSVDALMDALPTLNPRVLVLKLDYLGRTPITRAQLLATLAKAELTIVTYAFVRGYVLEALRAESMYTVKEPLTPAALRALVADGLASSTAADGAGPADQGAFGQLVLLESVPKSA